VRTDHRRSDACADAGTNTGANTFANAGAYASSDTKSHTAANTGADTGTDAEPDSSANSCANSGANSSAYAGMPARYFRHARHVVRRVPGRQVHRLRECSELRFVYGRQKGNSNHSAHLRIRRVPRLRGRKVFQR